VQGTVLGSPPQASQSQPTTSQRRRLPQTTSSPTPGKRDRSESRPYQMHGARILKPEGRRMGDRGSMTSARCHGEDIVVSLVGGHEAVGNIPTCMWRQLTVNVLPSVNFPTFPLYRHGRQVSPNGVTAHGSTILARSLRLRGCVNAENLRDYMVQSEACRSRGCVWLMEPTGRRSGKLS
jgi:hypothetical protein